MKMRREDIKLVPMDPNEFGCSTIFPYTINFPMPNVKPPIDGDEPDSEEPYRLPDFVRFAPSPPASGLDRLIDTIGSLGRAALRRIVSPA